MEARRFAPLLAIVLLTLRVSAAPLSDTVQVHTFPSHSRLAFKIDESVPVQLESTGDGFTATFKGLGFTDFGAPLGDEQAWMNELAKSLHDPRVASLVVKEVKGGLAVEGKWKFPEGPNAPAERKMETFDYRDHTREGSAEFVIDFWVKKGPTVAEVAATQKKQVVVAKVKKTRDDSRLRVERRLALEKEKREREDLTRSCKFPLADEKDVFFPLLSVVEKIDYSKFLPHYTADSGFPYFEPKSDEPDAQYVRLALKLYRENKFGLVIRTLDFLDAEHPQSPYLEEMRFLRANTLIQLEMSPQAERLLTQIKAESRGRPVALYSALYLAAKQIERKDPLGTYETFSWLFMHYPDNRLAWLFHLGAAESLSEIKQTEQAAKEYAWVAENAPTPWQKAQGALRIGNLYLDRRQYEQALAAYSTALRAFPEEATKFPPIHINRGEALYGLGEYERARLVFEDVVKTHSSHPEAWRAIFRLGEIYGRMAGETNQKISRQWFYETINRFPLSRGSTLARLRLLPCGDHGHFNFDSAQRFFEGEAKSFDGTGQLSMVHYDDLRSLAQVRSYAALEHGFDAVDAAEASAPLLRTAAAKAEIGKLFEGLLRKNILALIEADRKFDALKYFDEHSKYRVHGVESADPDYLLQLSLAASELRLGKLAESLSAEYKKASQSSRVVATNDSKKIQQDLDAALKRSEQSFAEARALWVVSGTAAENDSVDAIRKKLDQVVTESPFSFQKEIILGLLEQRLGKQATAREHALKAQLLNPRKNEVATLQIEAWLAGLEAQAGTPKTALGMYADLERHLPKPSPPNSKESEQSQDTAQKASDAASSNMAALLGVPPLPTLEEVLIAQGRILDSEKRWGDAAALYSRAMGEGLGGNQAAYGYAHALLSSGGESSREKALATLEKVASSKTDDFWKKLAKDRLEGEKLRNR